MLKLSDLKNQITVFLITFLLLSFSLKLAFILGNQTYLNVEPFEYEEAAQALLKGDGLRNIYLGVPYYALVHPMYPFFCSLVYQMGGSYFSVLLLQVVVSTFLGFLVYQIGRNLFSEGVGLLACVLTLFHPGLWVYSTLKLHSLVFDAAWFTGVLLLFLKLGERLSVRRCFITGLVGGLACLARSTLLLFILFGTVWLMWQWMSKTSLKHLIVCGVALVVTAGLVITPWVVRNSKKVGPRTTVVSTLGLNLWLGNHPGASGSAYTPEGEGILKKIPPHIREKLSSLTEWEQNQLLKEEAFRFIQSNPSQAVLLFWRKWRAFWWRSSQTGMLYPRPWTSIYYNTYGVFLISFFGGICTFLCSQKVNSWAKFTLILFFFLLVSIVQSIFFVEGRHRWSIEPVLLVFSAGGLHAFWLWMKCALIKRRALEVIS